jgi:peptidoglycan/xylan/chitin deacetylase (PgdA/CDA1 family)
MKTHGDAGWESFPTYLDQVVPRFLSILAQLELTITVFVVGQDAALEKNHAALARITEAGHEVGNHSFHHEPWLHRYTRSELDTELERAEVAIAQATGARPVGFRGPGYSLSRDTLEALLARGYRYDASTLPTCIGPLARAYYFLSTSLSHEQREQRQLLFGTIRDGMRPVKPYKWQLSQGTLLEIPVTTLPYAKLPIHLSYVIYLSTFAPRLANAYFGNALRICRIAGVEPSILLHPLDFLGADDLRELAFFPGMNMPSDTKLERVERYLRRLAEGFEVLPMRDHAAAILARPRLAIRTPAFQTESKQPQTAEAY